MQSSQAQQSESGYLERYRKSRFAKVKQLFFSGGAAAGRTLPSAIERCCEYGLSLKNVEVVAGSSVGSIMALAIALEIPHEELRDSLNLLRTENFKDWSFWHIYRNFFSTWGLCKGEAMPLAIRAVIKHYTGLEDPTFEQLQKGGCPKELRIVVTNITKKEAKVLSYKETPNLKVAEWVAISCSVPIIYPPQWKVVDGKRELYTDGGIIMNFPWNAGSTEPISPEEAIGFIFVNHSTVRAFNSLMGNRISSLMGFVLNLVVTVAFQMPLIMTKKIKDQIIAIDIKGINLFKFDAAEERQKILDKRGRDSVDAFMEKDVVVHLPVFIDDLDKRASDLQKTQESAPQVPEVLPRPFPTLERPKNLLKAFPTLVPPEVTLPQNEDYNALPSLTVRPELG